MSERFYIHTADDINKQLFDTESDFNVHIEELGNDEELLIRLCNLLNEQQDTIEGLLLDRNRQEEKLDIAREKLKKQVKQMKNQEQKIKLLQQELKLLQYFVVVDDL